MKVEAKQIDGKKFYNDLSISFEVKFDNKEKAIEFIMDLWNLEEKYGLI